MNACLDAPNHKVPAESRQGARTSLLLADYAGHAFTFELARELRRTGLDIAYTYCSTTVAPRADFAQAGHLDVYPVATGRTFEKYRLVRRVWSEVRYGISTARVFRRVAPARVVVCNMPILSLVVIWIAARAHRCATVVWLQDVQSGLAGAVLGGRHPAARLLTRIEGFLLARANRVVAISDALAAEAIRLGASPERVVVMENWAPVEQLPRRPKDNPWSRRQGLHDQKVFLYSGTLGRKHSPDLLLDLADAVQPRGASVLVISEGEGSDWLREQVRQSPRANLAVLPYQPFSDLPDVLATADVLVTLLDRSAGEFSVPSKTLAYLCAGRPVLASMPASNAAADLLARRSRAGIVVDPDDRGGFAAEAIRLIDDDVLREHMGQAGRAWADVHFAPGTVARRFLDAVEFQPSAS